MKRKEVKQFYDCFHQRKPNRVVRLMFWNRYYFLRSLLENQRGKVLVVGCGSDDEMSIVNDRCQGVGIDISKVAIEKSKQKYPRFKYLVADAMKMPFKKGEFDCLVCSEVIEHLPNEMRFLKEAFRVLKPGGRLIITTPNWLNWYGLARWLGEAILKKPLTAADQPIDHWYTYWSLKEKVDRWFFLEKRWGLWFFPPFGKGRYTLPDFLTYPLVKLFNPVNKLLRPLLPIWGHSLVFDLRRRS